jgi:glutathione S-transferase
MRMYDLDESGNCYKVRLLAAQLGITLELMPLDESDREPQLGDLNPVLEVPTLVLDDGRCLAQSGAILLYLADGSGLLPPDRYLRAHVAQWLLFEQTTHEPISRARFWLRWGDSEAYADRLAECQAAGNQALAILERHLATHPFLVDDSYSIADIALYAYTHIASEGGYDMGAFPAVRAWLNQVAAQPGHIPMLVRPVD